MSETWVGADEYEDIEEGAYDIDDADQDFGEESDRLQRERQRRAERRYQIMRHRQAQMRRPGRQPPRRVVGAPGPSRPTIRAIRSRDPETTAELDRLGRALKESNDRANRNIWFAVAGTVVSQGLDSLSPNPPNQYIGAGARAATLLLLSPQKKKGGAQGLITDQRTIGISLTFGIALLQTFNSNVHSVRISPVGAVAGTGTQGTLAATAKGRLGISVPNATFTWNSANTKVLAFPNSLSGNFTVTAKKGKGVQIVDVTAAAPNKVTDTIQVTVST